MENLAPILLFVYNRPEHTKKTIGSLLENDLASKSALFIYSDGPKNDNDLLKVREVRNYIEDIYGFINIEIVEQQHNLGLANSVISGVTEIINRFGKVIVLEDDLVSSKNFLKYMNDVLNIFEDDERIFSVSGYTFPIKIPDHYNLPVYLSPRSSSWGWGTWKNRWEKTDWKLNDLQNFIDDKHQVKAFNKGGEDLTRMLRNSVSGKVDSWSIKWTYCHFLHNAFCVYPVKSRIKNIGADKSGVHTSKTNKFNVELETEYIELDGIENVQPDKEILKNFGKFFKKNIISSTIRKLRD